MLLDHIGNWRDAGVGYATMGFLDLACDMSGMELFASEAMSCLR